MKDQSEQTILWLLQTTSRRMRRIEIFQRIAPPDEDYRRAKAAYQRLLERGDIAEFAMHKKVYVTISLQAQEWWRQN